MRTDSPTGNASDSRARSIRDALWAERPRFGRRAQAGAAVAAASLVAFALAGNAAAAGLGLLALAALVVAYERPYLLGPLVLLLLPAGERIHVLGAQVSPLEAVVGGGAIGYLARLAMRRERFRIRLADWAFAALVAFIAMSALGPVDNSDRFRELLFWGALGIVFHAVSALDTRRDLRLILVALAVSTLVEASWALFEYLDGWSDRFSLLGGAIVYPLPNGTLGHPNALAQFLVLAVLAVLALALGDAGAPRRLGFLAAGAGSFALIVTFSRASWIALAVGASVYLVERRTRVPMLIAGAVATVGAAALALLDAGAIGARISSLFRGETSELYDFRLELVRRAARDVAEYALTGSGHFQEVGTYAGRPDLATHPHNLFLGLAVFFGIPAAVAFAALVVLALRGAWKGLRTGSGAHRLTAVGFLAFIVAFLVNGFFEYPFWNTSLTVLVVLALAVAVTLDREVSQEPSSAPLADSSTDDGESPSSMGTTPRASADFF